MLSRDQQRPFPDSQLRYFQVFVTNLILYSVYSKVTFSPFTFLSPQTDFYAVSLQPVKSNLNVLSFPSCMGRPGFSFTLRENVPVQESFLLHEKPQTSQSNRRRSLIIRLTPGSSHFHVLYSHLQNLVPAFINETSSSISTAKTLDPNPPKLPANEFS